jgi:predicted amidophosphoribosyltransferase
VETSYADVRFGRDDLVPVLPVQWGACDVCHQGTSGSRCASCSRGMRNLLLSRPPTILPIALRIKGGPLAHATWAYKDSQYETDREQSARKLAWLVSHFMARHESCLAKAAAASQFDCIVPMPSSGKRQGTHPLVTLLRQLPWAADRLVEDLFFTGASGEAHRINEERYDYRGSRLDGRSVLLFDDTFTSGANVFSALDALAPTKAKVAVAIIGRHFDPDWSNETRAYYFKAESLPFDFGVCALCDHRAASRLGGLTEGPPAKQVRAESTDWDPNRPPF